jgi:hypothetical protein
MSISDATSPCSPALFEKRFRYCHWGARRLSFVEAMSQNRSGEGRIASIVIGGFRLLNRADKEYRF